MRTILAGRKHRSKEITLKGGIALLICFLTGVAAIVLLLYTLF
jgi:hypothetical protein